MSSQPLGIQSKEQLTFGIAVDIRPNWNADSRPIVFERQEENRSRLYHIRADGTGLEPLGLCNEGTVSFPAWSPDGTRLIYIQGHPTAEEAASGTLWCAQVVAARAHALPVYHSAFCPATDFIIY